MGWKSALVTNLSAMLPYQKGDFVAGQRRWYAGMGYFVEDRSVKGIVTGFELDRDDLLVAIVTTTTGTTVRVAAAAATRIEDLTKRKPGPEKSEEVPSGKEE